MEGKKAPIPNCSKNSNASDGESSNNEIALAQNMEKLTKEDATCPICLSIMIEPTTLPCKHSLCFLCYTTHIDVTSLQCPICRRRLSIWSRRNTKKEDLLDNALWERIKQQFPTYVEARLNGDDSEDLFLTDTASLQGHDQGESSSSMIRDGQMCKKPGEMWMELKSIMDQHNKELKNRRQLEEAASLSLIKSLLQDNDNKEPLSIDRSHEEQDYLLAVKLQEELNAGEPELPPRRSTRSRAVCEGVNVLEREDETSPVQRREHSPASTAKCSSHKRKSNGVFQNTSTSTSQSSVASPSSLPQKSCHNTNYLVDRRKYTESMLPAAATVLVGESENGSAIPIQLPAIEYPSMSTSSFLPPSDILVKEESDNYDSEEMEVLSIPGEENSPVDIDSEFYFTWRSKSLLQDNKDSLRRDRSQEEQDYLLAVKLQEELDAEEPELPPRRSTRARTVCDGVNVLEREAETSPIQRREHSSAYPTPPQRKSTTATTSTGRAISAAKLSPRNRSSNGRFQKTTTSQSSVSSPSTLPRKACQNTNYLVNRRKCTASTSAAAVTDLVGEGESRIGSALPIQLPEIEYPSTSSFLSSSDILVKEESDNYDNEEMEVSSGYGSALPIQLPAIEYPSTSSFLPSSDILVKEESDNYDSEEMEVSSIVGEENSPADIDLEIYFSCLSDSEDSECILSDEYYNSVIWEADIVRTRQAITRQEAEDHELAKKISRYPELYDGTPSASRSNTYNFRKRLATGSDLQNLNEKMTVEDKEETIDETKNFDQSQGLIEDCNEIVNTSTPAVADLVPTLNLDFVQEALNPCMRLPFKSSDCSTKEADEEENTCQKMPGNILGEVAELLEDIIQIVVELDK